MRQMLVGVVGVHGGWDE